MIWGGNKKDISKCLAILTWQKQNSTSSEDQQRSIRLLACYKSARMHNAKPILGVHKSISSGFAIFVLQNKEFAKS